MALIEPAQFRGKVPQHVVWGGIWVDCSVSESHVADSEVTSHPVEDGQAVTDNVRPKADLITLEGVISNTPIEVPQSHADGARLEPKSATFTLGAPSEIVGVTGGGLIGGAVAGLVAGALGLTEGGVTGQGFDRPLNRVANVYERLLEIRRNRELIDITTTLRVYESMIMESLQVVRDSEKGAGLFFTATARQVIIVSSELGDIPDPIVERGKPKTSKGKAPTGDVDPSVNTDVSLLGQLFGL